MTHSLLSLRHDIRNNKIRNNEHDCDHLLHPGETVRVAIWSVARRPGSHAAHVTVHFLALDLHSCQVLHVQGLLVSPHRSIPLF